MGAPPQAALAAQAPRTWRDDFKTIRAAVLDASKKPGELDLVSAEFCFHRANLMAGLIAKNGTAEVLGWLEGTIPPDLESIHPTLGVQWWYHVSALVRHEGKVYIADPLFDPIEVTSHEDVKQWMNRSMDSDEIGDHTEYRFIPPSAGNHAGINTTKMPAMNADDVTDRFKQSQASLPKDYAESVLVDKALLDISTFKNMLLEEGMKIRDAHAVVKHTGVGYGEARNALAHPLMLRTGAPPALPGPLLQHSPELVDLAERFERFVSQRLEI